jgi:hypothetical protein
MSLFGKIMAVLNFLGVIAVFVMALLVYSRHKAWVYTNYRYDLFMNGLPVTKADTDLQDYQRSLDLGSPRGRTLSELFPTDPVTTQVEEVERVKKNLDSKLAAVNTNRELHMDLLAMTLLPLAQSNRERESLLTVHTYASDEKARAALKAKMQAALQRALDEVKRDNKKNFAEEFAKAMHLPTPVPTFDPKNPQLTPPKGIPVGADNEPRRPFEDTFIRIMQPDLNKPFDGAFEETIESVRNDLKQRYDAVWDEALKGTRTEGGKVLTNDQRRHAVARLLVALDDSIPKSPELDADAFKSKDFLRVVHVIGLQEMNRELDAQAILLTRISQEQDKEIERERTTFALWHEALIAEARSAAQGVAQQDEQLRQLAEKVKEQDTLVNQRKKNVEDAKSELEARRKYTAEMIDVIHQMTDSIHKTRVEARDANEGNQNLVKKMRELENKR